MPDPEPNTEPTLVLSDLHLGHPQAPTPDQLRPLWQNHPHLLLNGDTAEVEIHHLKDAGRAAHDRLQHLLQTDGIHTTQLAGNHDGSLTPLRHHFFHHGHTLATHGDAFHPALAPWTGHAKPTTQFAIDQLKQRGHPPSTHLRFKQPPTPVPHLLEDRLRIAHEAAHLDIAPHDPESNSRKLAIRKPLMIFKVLCYWLRVPGYAVRFAQTYAPQSRVVLFGHSHHPGVWQRGPYTLINTGAFTFPGHPRAIRIHSDHLTVHRIQQHPDGNCHLTETPLYTHPIPTPSANSPS